MQAEIPSWGWVSARAHECLLVLREGTVVSMQQGGTVFKWPRDTVARVDTSVQRLQFTADQVTREKTGVAVTGLAVFRITRPELAYRLLDLDDPYAISSILTEMFVGATRRLVANLSLEDCLTRRKDALATELMTEVSPVVDGRRHGAAADDPGWGVAIDTIEIQDVRVLSDEVFERLQAPYREQLALSALRAADEVKREEAELERSAREAAENHRRALMALEEARLEAERERSRVAAQHAAALLREEAVQKNERERLECAGRAELNRMDAQSQTEVEQLLAISQVEVAKLEAAARRTQGEAEADVLRQLRDAQDTVSEARLKELALTDSLPRIAEAFAGSFDSAVVTGGDMSFLSAGVGQVLGTLEAFGVHIGETKPQ